MAKRLAAALLAAALGLGLTGCGAKEELPSRPEQAAFSAEVWEAERPQIAVTLTEPDIVETTFTHDDTGLAVARLLGQELIVYPRYAKLLQKGYADLPEEYRLLTALLNTDGTTLGITQGANTANARYVAGQIARRKRTEAVYHQGAGGVCRPGAVRGGGRDRPPECTGGCRSPGAIPVL